jgi:trehalose 6-phosphate phosphatase
MKHLLSLPLLEFAALLSPARGLLAFDFDGTLAPITVRRDEAAMRPSTQALFARLCRRFPCAVISGRGRDELSARLHGLNVAYLVGNHGIETGHAEEAPDPVIARAAAALADVVHEVPGVQIEHKGYSLSIHYRGAPEAARARADIIGVIAGLEGVRVVAGKEVVNLVPAQAPDKGDALARIMRQCGVGAALYIGDDTTDEDVFEHQTASQVVGVRVGKARTSAARYYLQGQWEVDHFLEALLRLEQGP